MRTLLSFAFDSFGEVARFARRARLTAEVAVHIQGTPGPGVQSTLVPPRTVDYTEQRFSATRVSLCAATWLRHQHLLLARRR